MAEEQDKQAAIEGGVTDEVLLRQQNANADAKKRKTYILTGVMLAFGILIILWYWHKSNSHERPSVVSAPSLTGHHGTFTHQTPKYARQLAMQNNQKARFAQQHGKSFVPAPVAPLEDINNLESTAPMAQIGGIAPNGGLPAAAPQVPSQNLPAAAPENGVPMNQQAEANQQLAQAMAGEIQLIEKSLTPQAQKTTLLQTPIPAASTMTVAVNTGKSATVPQAALPARPGDLFYAVMDTALNSDSPGPAMATIVSGKLQNTKVLGGFKRENKNLVVQLDMLVMPDGSTYKIKAYAVNPNTSMVAVRTSVNNHYLSRWGGLIAGSFLAGYGQAVAQSGTTAQTVAGPGGVTTITTNPVLTGGKELEIAAGQTAQQFNSIAQQNFQRPPTVKLASGTGIGILIISISPGGGKS